MNYQRIYDELISAAELRGWIKHASEDAYTETHHKIPKCMNGSDNVDNLVELSAREHYIAHWLLYKIHKSPRLAHAWALMCVRDKNQRRYTSHSFKYAKLAKSKAMRGRKLSESHKRKVSESLKGVSKGAHSEARRLKIGNSLRKGSGYSSHSSIPSDANKRPGRRVISKEIATDITTEFTSLAAAARGTNSDSSKISKCCRGTQLSHNGRTWEYAGEV